MELFSIRIQRTFQLVSTIAYFDGVPKGGTYFKRARQRGMSIVNLF